MSKMLKVQEIFLLHLLHSNSRIRRTSSKAGGWFLPLVVPSNSVVIPHCLKDRYKIFASVFQLPIKIDIIKHASEIDGKSTAAHAAVIAPEDVTIYTYPCIPDYSTEENVSVQTASSLCIVSNVSIIPCFFCFRLY